MKDDLEEIIERVRERTVKLKEKSLKKARQLLKERAKGKVLDVIEDEKGEMVFIKEDKKDKKDEKGTEV